MGQEEVHAMKPLSEFPRIHLGVFPTPLQRLDNISSYLNTNVWIKRDDMTGVALGGNKVRKLEFLLPETKVTGIGVRPVCCGCKPGLIRFGHLLFFLPML